MPTYQIEWAQAFLPQALKFCAKAKFTPCERILKDFLSHLDGTIFEVLGPLPFDLKSMDASTFMSELEHLSQSLHEEMKKHKYVQVMPDRIEYLSQQKLFGDAVYKAFPGARYEIAEAGNCLAVEANTAAVFHLMRAAEFGLRALARDRRVALPRRAVLDLATWETIIKELEDAELAIQGYPRTLTRELQFEFYHGAMMEFKRFKNKFRNGIMHTRDEYDRTDALSALTHTKAFMGILASRISETKRTPLIWKGK